MSNIGLGSKIEIDDGAASAYQSITAVVALGVPHGGELQFVDSKRLDLTGGLIARVATLKTPGNFTIKWEFDGTQYARLEALKGVQHNFKITLTDTGAGTWVRIAPGKISVNKIDDVEADAIETVTTTVEVVGPVS